MVDETEVLFGFPGGLFYVNEFKKNGCGYCMSVYEKTVSVCSQDLSGASLVYAI